MPERPLLDKLGVKPRMRVSLLDVGEDWFRELLAERTGDLHDAPVQGSDLVFMKAETPADLEHLGSLRRLIRLAYEEPRKHGRRNEHFLDPREVLFDATVVFLFLATAVWYLVGA